MVSRGIFCLKLWLILRIFSFFYLNLSVFLVIFMNSKDKVVFQVKD